MNREVHGRRIRVEWSNKGSRGREAYPSTQRARRSYHPSDRCYNCGECGHYAYDCDLYQRRNASRRRWKRLLLPLLIKGCLKLELQKMYIVQLMPFASVIIMFVPKSFLMLLGYAVLLKIVQLSSLFIWNLVFYIVILFAMTEIYS